MEHKLTILIVNYNSSDFIESSLFILKKLTKNEYVVNIMDNNSNKEDYQKLKEICRKYDNVNVYLNKTDLKGGVAHGSALNELVKTINTPYFSIIDADAIWLKKNWDEILINRMTEKIKIIGTETNREDPENFPLIFAILIETETFKKMNIDFRPKDVTIHQDTGWEIREKYLKEGLKAISLESKNTRDYKEGPFKNVFSVIEYYLDNNYEEIFASHFGRGSNPLAKRFLKTRDRKLDLLLLPINYFFWRRQKSRWIKICKKVAISQAEK